MFFALSDGAQYLGSELRLEDDPSGFTQLLFQIIRTISWGVEDYATLSRLYYFIAIISVSLNLSSSEDWPPLFGSWSDAYCLRNFWG